MKMANRAAFDLVGESGMVTKSGLVTRLVRASAASEIDCLHQTLARVAREGGK
jgi:hypothetical protein